MICHHISGISKRRAKKFVEQHMGLGDSLEILYHWFFDKNENLNNGYLAAVPFMTALQ